MQYITQCPHYSSVITTPFRTGQLPSFQIVKEQPIDASQTVRKHQATPPMRRCLLIPGFPVAGGANRDRTGDLLLAKQALSQLSYGPSRPSSWAPVGGSGWIRTIDPRLIKTVL